METKHDSKSWVQGLSLVCLTTLTGVIGPVLFLLITTIVESFQPGYDPLRETISILVWGPQGWLQTFIFLLFGFLLIVFAVRLYFAIGKSVSLRLGFASLVLIALGFFLIGVFPTQRPGMSLTLHSLIHVYTAYAISILFILACFAFALRFRADTRWKKFFLYTVITGVIALILNILWVVVPSDWYWKGLHERILVVNSLTWIAVMAVYLLQSCLRELWKSWRLLRALPNILPR